VNNYSQFKRAHLFENIFTILSEPQNLSARRLWIKQRSSLFNPIIVTKLQFIVIKTEAAKIANVMHLTRDETHIPNGVTCFAHPL